MSTPKKIVGTGEYSNLMKQPKKNIIFVPILVVGALLLLLGLWIVIFAKVK